MRNLLVFVVLLGSCLATSRGWSWIGGIGMIAVIFLLASADNMAINKSDSDLACRDECH
ncbi:hypothetical protein HBA55_18925 [Pseudomaricurvus alkylphenolicus]|jgi:hypothetical protein|uniref:hypothetical protein n=1 Tax=Pseudomaricurvus alkylphenolicus TaxID=1306991 RepID=UPI0014246563|nr:hypothetical protein [Pseudomaricurvus alkylphenolicus]NIB41686.1 hypothetical protein [Pseudomaricurvus alkylphenolicus]